MSFPAIHIRNMDGLEYMQQYVADGSINLILTDPPYIISKPTGMNTHYNNVQNGNIQKTAEEWEIYKRKHHILNDNGKENYLQYGSIYGKKYCIQTMFGKWDEEFTVDLLDEYIANYYKKLKSGGTLILFCDLWKITLIRHMFEMHNFKQIRFIEWIKTNPVPRNSKINYLTNCREIAVVGIKHSKPTFNSSFDKGIYHLPIPAKNLCHHPNQKNLTLFESLVKKHSHENDIVMDTFLGSGTTLFACMNTNRQFRGCEIEPSYFKKIEEMLVVQK